MSIASCRVARLGGAFLVTLLVACAPLRPPSVFETDYEEQHKTWTEIVAQLPPAPRPADLAIFPVSGGSNYTFAIDRPSISIGSDGVFRYTLVATSASGVRNVSYEGIRCQTQERRIYATGMPDGSWVRARNSDWTRIEEVGNNRQQAALMKDVFCPDGYPAQSLQEIGDRLGRTPPSLNTV